MTKNGLFHLQLSIPRGVRCSEQKKASWKPPLLWPGHFSYQLLQAEGSGWRRRCPRCLLQQLGGWRLKLLPSSPAHSPKRLLCSALLISKSLMDIVPSHQRVWAALAQPSGTVHQRNCFHYEDTQIPPLNFSSARAPAPQRGQAGGF